MSVLDRESERVLAAAVALMDTNPDAFWEGVSRYCFQRSLVTPVLLVGEQAKAYSYLMDCMKAAQLAEREAATCRVRLSEASKQFFEASGKS